MKNIPSSICNQIFDILVAHAGAHEDDRTSFVRYYSTSDERPSEYRCCHKWGLAGKFWWNDNRFYVSGPGPNEFSKSVYEKSRKECEEVDVLLAPLYEQFQNYRTTVGMMEAIPAYPQNQSSLEAQLRILIPVANRLGLQDAADFLVGKLER